MPNIVIQGDTLNNVPAFNFKDAGNHTVTFYYTGDADAIRSDVANGKVFYTANGKTTGTYIPTSYDIGPATVTVTSSYTPTDPELTCTPPTSYMFGANEFGLDGIETLKVDLQIENDHSVSSAAYNWSGGQDTVISASTGAGYIAMVNAHLVKPLNLEPENIKNGVVIGGITGTYNPSSSVTYTVTDATDGDVLSGRSFYKATSTTTATLTTGSLYNGDGYLIGTTTGDTISLDTSNHRVKLLPVNNMFIGGSGDMGNGLHTTYSDLAVAINLISSATETTSSKISTGNTILGITGTGSSGGFNIDLTGTTWVLNSVINLYPYSAYYIYFEDGYSHNTWSILDIDSDGKSSGLQYKDGKSDTTVYINNSWVNNGYKTITITGGSDVSNPLLVAWLLQNATKQ